MNRKSLAFVASATLILAGGPAAAHDRGRDSNLLAAQLASTNEVPAVSSAVARGSFKATIDEENQTITYELSYEGMEGIPGQAHIHVGQRGANGGISVYLCGNPPLVPAATFPQPPACPPSPATVTGVLTPAHITGPTLQGIAPTSGADTEFAELVELLRSGLTYANVHSSKFGSGEIRGQVKLKHGDVRKN